MRRMRNACVVNEQLAGVRSGGQVRKVYGVYCRSPGVTLGVKEWNGVAPYWCLGSPGMHIVEPRQ